MCASRHRGWLFLQLAILLTLLCGVALASPPGYTFRMGQKDAPDTIDVWTWSGGRPININLYEPLVTFMNTEVKVYPALAESWNISQDGMSYTFYLRKGVKYTDGAPFNAEAAKFGIERVQGIGLGPSKYIDVIKSMEVVDEYTLKINIKAPSAGFLIGLHTVLFVSPKSWEANKTADDPWAKNWFHNHSAGTGAYVLDEWKQGEYVHLVRNEQYWRGWGPNQVQDAYYVCVEEPSVQRLMLEKGDLDLAPRISSDDAIALKDNPNIVIRKLETLVTGQLMMNTSRGPLSNLLVRRAVAHCFDFKAFETLTSGFATPLSNPFLPEFTGGPIEPIRSYPYDLEKARQLLSDAGYEPGQLKLRMAIMAGNVEWMRQAEVLQAGLREVGVDLSIQELPWPTITAMQSKSGPDNWDVVPYNAASGDGTAAAVGKLIFHSSGIGYRNLCLYSNQVVDSLIDEAMMTADFNERVQLESLVARIVMEDCPAVFTHRVTLPLAYRSWITELDWDPTEYYMYYFYEMRISADKGGAH